MRILSSHRVVLGGTIVGLAAAISGCGGGSGGGSTTGPTTNQVLNDPSVHHIGDERRNEFRLPLPEGTSIRYTFNVSQQPSSARIRFEVFDLDNIGTDIVINGSIAFSLIGAPAGSGGNFVLDKADFDATLIRSGDNTLLIRSRRSGSLFEDFEFANLTLTVTGGSGAATSSPQGIDPVPLVTTPEGK